MKAIFLLLLTHLSLVASDFPTPYNSEPDPSLPLPPAEAAAAMKLPPGFKATVFAAEPDVQNPIALAWDGRGRLWVAENYTYAERAKRFDLNLRDRILIFEDKDGDGHFDKRSVFTDELQMLTSVEVGHGGVWAFCPPQLLFIPDRNGDGVPDGPPQVVLDGFTVPSENYHNFANGLHFGPDGWLYGRCGASSPAEIGLPGAAAEERIPMRGTIWRYHPGRKVVEVLTSGTTNPWGSDWNEYGELFFINTVNGHLWHDFPGAHYVRPHTIDPNPRAYSLIDMHADHWHFDTAEGWAKSRGGSADSLGGGHAHVGMMIYLGDNWPAEYRGHLFTLNLHGRRANQEILERSGSGYVGHHGKDFFIAGDPWFRGMEISYGPDGGVFVLDWSDTGECHDSTGVHRTSGRIFKITYGQTKQPVFGSLAQMSVAELVQLHLKTNEWFSRQARLELIRRAENGTDLSEAKEQLRALFEQEKDAVIQLRALWTLHDIGGTDEPFLRAQLGHANEHVRVWAIRLLTDSWPLDTVLSQRPFRARHAADPPPAVLAGLERLAAHDESGLVRLALASTLQRLPASLRPGLAAPLLTHGEDANDHNLPLLIWYGLIPLGDSDPLALEELAENAEIPAVRKFAARRLVEDIDKNPAPLNQLIAFAGAKPSDFQADVLNGMSDGLTGWRKATKPKSWEQLALAAAKSSDPLLRERTRSLSLLFGDGLALEEVKKIALDSKADLKSRKTAVQTLIDNNAPDARAICVQLLNQQFLNSVAARGLTGFDDPEIARKLVGAYRSFHPSERGQLLSALVSRVSLAEALLNAVGQGRIPRVEITPYHARQIRSLGNEALSRHLTEVWGEIRDLPQDKQQQIALWKARLNPVELAKADLAEGRVVFNMACSACHTLYGEGGKVGPDLTGGGRENLDYLLENVVDPSALVSVDFKMSVVRMKDGRVLNGLIAAQAGHTLTLKTMTESITIERSEIKEIRESAVSLMPEGLLDALTPRQARDLVAYLSRKTQVPLPLERKSATNQK